VSDHEIEKWQQTSEQLVRDHWLAIEAVAMELGERKWLSARDVRVICKRWERLREELEAFQT